jgi:hypothetical protein
LRLPSFYSSDKKDGMKEGESMAARLLLKFDTGEYEFSHGHKPRGRGSWAFDFGAKRTPDGLENLFWTRGTYGEAKRQARAFARWLAEGLDDGHLVCFRVMVCS